LRVTLAVAVIAAAVAAAILLNLALLGYAQPRNDPVGKLSPRAVLQPGSAPAPPVATANHHGDQKDRDD
jgi:hypothetical protein